MSNKMRSQRRSATTFLLLAAVTQTRGEVPQDAAAKGIQAIETLLETRSDVAMRKFIRDNLAKSLREELSSDQLQEKLGEIRVLFGNFGGILIHPEGDGAVRIKFEGCNGAGRPLTIMFDPEPPHKIIELEVGKREAASRADAPPRLTWANLAKELSAEGKKGFSGSVLVVRDGKVFLNEGYGFANREKKIPCTKNTIYAVGSTPIDFTQGAIYKLEELGVLKTSDPITKFFDNVPDDKKTITIDHLISGQSGLSNFHHISAKDENYDLTWIDRETAIKRIFAKELRFAPGEGKAHSHSAFGVLAAIVEIASQKSYQDFLDEHFFIPAGMKNTTIYQRTTAFNSDDIAVGYGGNNIGKINAPQYWGDTSWLVLGSGGMVSSPDDLYKWVDSIWTGKTLSPKAKKKYWRQAMLAGGNDRGFLTIYRQHPDTMFFMCSNADSPQSKHAQRLAKGLQKLMGSN